MARDLRFNLLLTARDAASAAFAKVTGATEKLSSASAKLADSSARLRIARENVADFAQRGTDALRGLAASAGQFEGASLDLQQSLQQLGGDGAAALQRLQDRALQWSTQHQATSEQYLAVSARMVGAYQDELRAQVATESALRAAAAARSDVAGTAEAMMSLYSALGDRTRSFSAEHERIADVIAATRQAFGSAFDAGALGDPLKDAASAAVAARVPLEQVVATIGALNAAGIKGGEAGAGFANVISALTEAQEELVFELERTSDGGVDLIGSIASLRTQFGALDTMSAETRAYLGEVFGPAQKEIFALLGHGERLDQQFAAIAASGGRAAENAAIVDESGVGKLAQYNNAVENLKIVLGTGLIPALTEVATVATSMLDPIMGFARQHPEIVAYVGTFAVLTVVTAQVAAGVLSLAGTVTSLGSVLTGAGAKGAAAFSKIGSGAVALGARLLPMLASATASAWAFGAALLANPITWVVAAVVAAAALIYTYWGPITEFFGGLWSDIRGAFEVGWVDGILKVIELFSPVVWIAKGLDAVTQYLFGFSLFDAGKKIVTTIGEGIVAMASYPVDKMRSVVGAIRNLLPFSPAKDGPLRDLHRVKLIETVAEAVRPEPLVTAMRGAAALGLSALASAPAPALAASSSLPSVAALPSRGGSVAAGVSIGSVTIHVSGDADRSVIAQLEAWVRDPDNAAAIAAAVTRDQQRRSLAEYR